MQMNTVYVLAVFRELIRPSMGPVVNPILNPNQDVLEVLHHSGQALGQVLFVCRSDCSLQKALLSALYRLIDLEMQS